MKKKAVVWSLVLLVMLGVSGCTDGPFSRSYQQISPTTYPRTKNVIVFYYPNVNIQTIYDKLFSDFVIIGTVGFNDIYRNPYATEYYSNITTFGKSLGADVFICTAQFSNTEVTGAVTTYGQAFANTRIVKNEKYNQFGIFLKNINNVVPVWNQTRANYKKTTANELEGVWSNKDCKLDIFQSDNQIVGFINEKSPKKRGWNPGDLKMIFYAKTGKGVYLTSNRTPSPAEMNLTPNKFGFLELTLSPNNQIVSFQREQ
jgi:hypothetical protein